ncbi:hypothetical protein LCGC14_0370290 [marine sediment metagenome]|uniref:Uncharacterized protein n=1 Tax=marine sediment metagenome TaxID=412755 RepID=A0A0F9T5L1_9ZZZZ
MVNFMQITAYTCPCGGWHEKGDELFDKHYEKAWPPHIEGQSFANNKVTINGELGQIKRVDGNT